MLPTALATFLFLFGLFWQIKPVPPPPENPETEEDAERNHKAYRKAKRRQAMMGIFRLMSLLVGGFGLLSNLILWPGRIDDTQGFLLLLACYGGIILATQRAEVNRRLATLVILSLFVGFLVNSYAYGRGLVAENTWALYAALLLNYAFWLIVGRRYPPRTSEDIHVWGMDDI